MLSKLRAIQSELEAPKNLRNSFGNYNYRSAEGILEALKPHLKKHDLVLTISDELVNIGERYYVKATVSLTDGEKTITTTALAREEETKKGMDGSQITGASSSYARKYALNGMFAIDDTKDSDATNEHDEKPAKKQEKPKQETKKASASDNEDCPICGKHCDNVKHGETNWRQWHMANCECGDKFFIRDSFYDISNPPF